jgi:predicted AlkP superfamily pyrophosphatase or phosphodiesterase
LIAIILGRLRFARLLIVAALLACGLAGQPAKPRPYVVLVSLDGFRYDYAERYLATNLLEIGKAGAAAKGLIPVFPSLTFPNHVSIVTGLYPEHHGIVENGFYDPARKEFYGVGARSRDASWYRAKPLWVLAEEQRVKAASMFWPSTDAEILGIRPSYWKVYDSGFPNDQRVAQVLDWLKLPEDQRPHFITVYFGDVDAAGHRFGPESTEAGEAVRRIDKLVGDLWKGIQALHLPVNLIVVSDHGKVNHRIMRLRSALATASDLECTWSLS